MVADKLIKFLRDGYRDLTGLICEDVSRRRCCTQLSRVRISLSLSILIAKLEIIDGHASGCIIDALERCVD